MYNNEEKQEKGSIHTHHPAGYSSKSDHVFNILNICATLFKMLHHCMTCNVSQYLQKNAAYIKPLKKVQTISK